MKVEALQFDAVVAGSGVAAYATAILYARSGVRVGLVTLPTEQGAAFTRTSILHPAARSVLDSLRLDYQPGATPGSQIEIWTRWGWIADHLPFDSPNSVFANQATLTDQLADLAARTADLTVIAAACLEEVLTFDGKVAGLRIWREDSHQPMRVLGRLTIAAANATSPIATLARLPAATHSQQHVRYHARYLLAPVAKARLWLLDPGIVGVVPHEDGVTEVTYLPAPESQAEFEKDPERSFAHLVASLPDRGALKSGQRISGIIGSVITPQSTQPDTPPGLVLIGGENMAFDPLWGADTDRALQAAEWLVRHTVYALMVSGEIQKGLSEYRRWQQATDESQRRLADLMTGRPLNRREKLLLAGAARDATLAHHVQSHIARLTDDLFAPDMLARATWINMTNRLPASIPVTQS